jgi:hypothetical protein
MPPQNPLQSEKFLTPKPKFDVYWSPKLQLWQAPSGVLNLTWFCQLFFTLFLFFDVQKKSDFWQKSDFSVL